MPPATLFRYISIRTIAAVLSLFAILSSIVLLVDLIENLRFVGKIEGGTFGLAVALSLMRMPALAQAMTPFVFLFASIWMFNELNKRSEVAVMRSAGLSIWKLLSPAALIAALAGIAIILVFDPVSANLLAAAEGAKAQRQGQNLAMIRVFGDGIWLRQRDQNYQMIINAQSFNADAGMLNGVRIWRTGRDSAFIERIDAQSALLTGEEIELQNVQLRAAGDSDSRTSPIYVIRSSIRPDELGERAAPPESMSMWQLPRYILLAETAGLPTKRYEMRFHDLSSTPLKLLAMVLIAAVFSLRPTRMGGALPLLIVSIAAGFALYILSEISSALGESGAAPVVLAAWTPALTAAVAAISALLHIEDG